jgi:hypothetical protein
MGADGISVGDAPAGVMNVVAGCPGYPMGGERGGAVRLDAPLKGQPARLARVSVLRTKLTARHVSREVPGKRHGAVRRGRARQSHAPSPVECIGGVSRRRGRAKNEERQRIDHFVGHAQTSRSTLRPSIVRLVIYQSQFSEGAEARLARDPERTGGKWVEKFDLRA